MPESSAPIDRVQGRVRSRRAMAVTVAAVVAAAAVGGAGIAAYAYFTAQATVSGQQVGTATIDITAGTAAQSALIDVDDLLPGDTATSQIVVENTGTEDLYYTVTLPTTGNGDAALESVLQASVSAGGVVATSTLADWQTGALQVDTRLAPGEAETVYLSVKLPEPATNAVQGTATEFAVRVDATQARNLDEPTPGWMDQ